MCVCVCVCVCAFVCVCVCVCVCVSTGKVGQHQDLRVWRVASGIHSTDSRVSEEEQSAC